MKKLLSLALIMAAFTTTASAQLLYKVSGNGLEKPSFVVGIHRLINPQGVVQQIPGVKDAIFQTDQMYFESAPDSASFIKAERTLKDGKKLKDVLTAEQYAKLNTFLKKYESVGLESPHVQKRYGTLTPLALKGELEKLLFVANHMSEYDPTHTFNEYFQAQAKVNNEPTYGLTPVESQVKALQSAPLDKQADVLMNFIEHEDAELGAMDRIAADFGKQDVEALAKDVNNGCCAGKRMAAWASKMSSIMQKPTLFVIEATKLGGESGLLTALKNAGYTVEGVK